MIDVNRRGFLGAIISAAVAPAIIKAGVLMPIKPALVMASFANWGTSIPYTVEPSQRDLNRHTRALLDAMREVDEIVAANILNDRLPYYPLNPFPFT